MSSNWIDFRIRVFKKAVLITTVAILTIGAMSCSGLPVDIIHQNISMEEAQGLVSFTICTPSYLPNNIDPNPIITYTSDAANVPEETYIRLLYKYLERDEKAYEIFQRPTNKEELKLIYPKDDIESFQNSAKVLLVWWVSEPKQLNEQETIDAVEKTVLVSQGFQTGETIWWMFTITDPDNYHSIMSRWVKDKVEYRILSFLTAEEVTKLTFSMLNCSN